MTTTPNSRARLTVAAIVLAAVALLAIVALALLLDLDEDDDVTVTDVDDFAAAGELNLGPLVAASGVDANGCPTEVPETFGTDREVIYIVLTDSDVPVDTTLTVNVSAGATPVYETDPYATDQRLLNGCISFRFEPAIGETIDAGTYDATLLADGVPMQTATFTVE